MQYWLVTLRGTKQKIIFIDTKGLDNNQNEEDDKKIVSELLEDLQNIDNIYMCILFIKKNVRLSGSFLVSIENYKPFMNLPGPNKDQSVIFKTFLTHCDLSDKPSDPDGDNFLK